VLGNLGAADRVFYLYERLLTSVIGTSTSFDLRCSSAFFNGLFLSHFQSIMPTQTTKRKTYLILLKTDINALVRQCASTYRFPS
jgi:hypothetical protein